MRNLLSLRSLRSVLLAAFALAAAAAALPACNGGGGEGAAAPDPDGFTAISAGYFSSCALRRDGSLVCWGLTDPEPDPDGVVIPIPPPEDETLIAVSNGWYDACGLREDGSPVCWGLFGSLTPPEGERFTTISVGSYACGLREDGSPVCWGNDRELPEGERFTAISVGLSRACGLREDGAPVCWDGFDPGYGLGTLTPPEGERFTTISVADAYACGLRRDGSPVCWAAERPDAERWPAVDDLGAWAPWEADEASSAEDGERFIALSAYPGYACALRENGSPVCWNFSEDLLPFGQTSPPKDERFTAISASFFHACALREDGSPVCWGSLLPHYDAGQAAPPGGDRLQPALPAGERFTAISNASDYVCALREDGAPVCAGRGAYSYYAPPDGETLTSISVSESQACGLREDGSLVCWPGDDAVGRLWDQYIAREAGPYSEYGAREAPPPDGAFIAVSVGEFQACALREDGSPACWVVVEIEEGAEAAAQGGWDLGTTGRPPAGERFSAISVGTRQACGLRRDGSPVCWPLDDDAAAGTTPAPRDEALTAISVGDAYACALRRDGSPVCWGDGRQEQTSPPAGEVFKAISSGRDAACGLRENGSFICWGSGVGTSSGRVEGGAPGTEAWPPGEDERFIAVSAGDQRVCAIRTDGSSVCWGGSIPS